MIVLVGNKVECLKTGQIFTRVKASSSIKGNVGDAQLHVNDILNSFLE